MRYAIRHCNSLKISEGGTKYTVFTGKCIDSDIIMQVKVRQESIELYEKGMYIQDACPELTRAEREFLISGCSSDGFDAMFKA